MITEIKSELIDDVMKVIFISPIIAVYVWSDIAMSIKPELMSNTNQHIQSNFIFLMFWNVCYV